MLLGRDSDRPESDLIGGRKIFGNSSSEDCLRLAKLWLSQCVEYHGCSISANPSSDNAVSGFRPSRTIDVGPPGSSRNPRLICHNGSEDSVGGELTWATLSHCWGGSSPLTTTSSNIAHHIQSIPLDSMPPVFRDAVTITRVLGIRHLWIDSLCIIQDSASDWEIEAARMVDVYRNGILNIAASNARTCDDKILGPRDQPSEPITLPLNSEQHNIRSIMFARSGRWDDFRTEIMGPNTTSTLDSRAWVLQESLLSPRTLHYGKRQMVWECLSCSLNEGSAMTGVDPSKALATHYMHSNKMLLPREIALHSDGIVDNEEMRVNLYDLWLQIIVNYTRRRLTFQSDKLAALAGAASLFQRALGDRYLAGLFEGDLLRSLLWRTTDLSSSTVISPSLASSWSWASLTGAVKPEIAVDSNMITPVLVGNFTAQIHDAAIYKPDGSPAPADYLLHTSQGILELEGLILHGSSLAELSYEGETLPSIEGDTGSPNIVHRRQNSLHLDKLEDLQMEQDVSIFHLGAWEWRYNQPRYELRSVETKFAGLVLRRTAQDVYKRVGIAEMYVGVELKSASWRWIEDVEEIIGERWRWKSVTVV